MILIRGKPPRVQFSNTRTNNCAYLLKRKFNNAVEIFIETFSISPTFESLRSLHSSFRIHFWIISTFNQRQVEWKMRPWGEGNFVSFLRPHPCCATKALSFCLNFNLKSPRKRIHVKLRGKKTRIEMNFVFVCFDEFLWKLFNNNEIPPWDKSRKPSCSLN